MSRSASVRLFFGDADYDFRLRIGECEELQELSDAGLMVTLSRLSELRIKDIKAVIRLGLIGGGLPKKDAFVLVDRHVAPGEFADCAVLATQIVNAAISGIGDEPLGEPAGSGIGDPHSPMESSATPTSTAPAPPSASVPNRSRKRRSGV